MIVLPLPPRVIVSDAAEAEREKFGAGFTVTETGVECTPLPLTVSMNGPVAVDKVVAIESVEVAEPPDGGVTEAGLTVQVVDAGHPVTVRATELLNPLIEVTVTVDVTVLVCVTETGVVAEIPKSGVPTVTPTVVE